MLLSGESLAPAGAALSPQGTGATLGGGGAARGGPPVGPRLTTVTGLRRGADTDGRIARDALSRLRACIAGYGEMMRARGVVEGVALGIDLAGYGTDESTIAVRRGDNLVNLVAESAGRIDHFINDLIRMRR